MALNISSDGHPNKLPFTGVLTRVGVASDQAPAGTGGKRTLITKAAAKTALKTLLGMGVDYVEGLDGHDPQAKIGIITSADIAGTELRIGGFFYASDFPELVKRIQDQKAILGFSYEAQATGVEDHKADPWIIDSLVFTGAAVLRKSKAAYESTSIAAESGDSTKLNAEDLQAMIEEKVKAATAPLLATLEKLTERRAAFATHSVASPAPAEAPARLTDDPELKRLAGAVETLCAAVSNLDARIERAGSGVGRPTRKTAIPNLSAAASKFDLAGDEEGGIDLAKLDDVLARSSLSTRERLTLKNELRLGGLLRDRH